VARLKNKPFVIIGVNSDGDRQGLLNVMKKEQITWRFFWDKSTTGPIHTMWNVHLSPTTYVIGPKGVIRGKFLGAFDERDLEVLVDKLLGAKGID
jgi:hypothetical protein